MKRAAEVTVGDWWLTVGRRCSTKGGNVHCIGAEWLTHSVQGMGKGN